MVAGVVLLVFSAVVVFGSYREISHGRTVFEHQSQLAFDKVKSASDIVEGVLASLRGLPSSSLQAAVGHSEIVAGTLLGDYRFVAGMGRYEALEHEHRVSFETVFQADSGSGIWEYQARFGDDVQIAPADQRSRYYPVLYAMGRHTDLDQLSGFDLGSDRLIANAVRESGFSNQPALVGVPVQWSGDGHVLVFRSANSASVSANSASESAAGHWVELDLQSMIAGESEWQGVTEYAVDLTARAFEFDTVAPESIELLRASAGRVVDGDLTLGFLKPYRWTGVDDVGGHILKVTFERRPTVSWANLVLWSLIAAAVSLVLLLIHLLNARRQLAIAEQQRQLAALHRTQQRASVTLASIREAVITIDDAGTIVYANAATEDLLAVPAAEIVQRPVDQVLLLADERTAAGDSDCAISQIFHLQTQSSAEFQLTRIDGGVITVSQTNSPLFDLDGQQTGNVLVLRDISRERELTAALEHQANHDPLTGAANRLRFEQVIGELFQTDLISERGHALCYADLDQFKAVNDTCGHGAGDELLVMLANGIRGRVREHDLIARLGGDEFAIIIRDCAEDSAEAVVERVYEFFQSFHFQHSGLTFPVRASIGYVHFKPQETDFETVLQTADAACYEAKRSGRNQIRKRLIDSHIPAPSEQAMGLPVLQSALDQGAFELRFEPIAKFDGTVLTSAGSESFLELAGNEGQTHGAIEITSVAERHGLIGQIECWHIQRAIETFVAAGTAGDQTLVIDLTTSSVTSASTAALIGDSLQQHGLPAQQLCIDITEATLLQDYEAVKEGLQRFADLGCQIAVSEFGSGVSSLTTLADVPVHRVKLDLARFINNADPQFASRVLQTVCGFASGLGVAVVVENVVDAQGLAMCAEMEASWVQGAAVTTALASSIIDDAA